MELKIKARVTESYKIEEVVSLVRKIEKEYSCNCTLLEIECQDA